MAIEQLARPVDVHALYIDDCITYAFECIQVKSGVTQPARLTGKPTSICRRKSNQQTVSFAHTRRLASEFKPESLAMAVGWGDSERGHTGFA